MNPPLLHWIPYKLVKQNQEYFFEWIYLGEKRFNEPFFEETILKCRALVENSKGLKVLSHAQAILEWSQPINAVKPIAFIFHVSRCGSTMLSQAITLSERNIVIPEVPILDDILREPDMSEDFRIQLFMAVLKFLGQIRFPKQQNLILKMDSWHLMYLEQLRSYFPKLPFVILTRQPEEILKSHKRNRGMHMVPSLLPASMFGTTDAIPSAEKLDDYAAWVLQKYYLAIERFRHTDQNLVVCDYSQGFKQIINCYLEITGEQFSTEESDLVDARLKKHSKKPDVTFEGDADLPIEIEDLERLKQAYSMIFKS